MTYKSLINKAVTAHFKDSTKKVHFTFNELLHQEQEEDNTLVYIFRTKSDQGDEGLISLSHNQAVKLLTDGYVWLDENTLLS